MIYKHQQPIIVKLVCRGTSADESSPIRRQIPLSSGQLGVCRFTFNPHVRKYDWLVIIDDIPKVLHKPYEPLACPENNTILVTTEPSAITRYGRAFASQFHYLITNQEEAVLPHPNAIRSQTGNFWFYGKSYDEIVAMKPPVKTKPISTVCSNKQQGHTIHKKRFEFTAMLQASIKEVERFGKGYRWIENKADAIDPYQFHVTIENHYAPHVWTEKLADAFLGYSVPIYYGCPNVFDYFPKESIIPIDIFKPQEAIETIRRIISTPGEYERRLDAVIEARRRVIEEYNLPAMINRIVESAPQQTASVSGKKIYNRRWMRARHLPDFFRFAAWKTSILLKR